MQQTFRSLTDFDKVFPNEQSCRDYLEKARWESGLACVHCGSTRKIFRVASGKLFKCADCKRQFSVRVGTIFEDSALPLRKWFMAIYILTAHKKGISSVQLSKDIKVTQKTAWFMLHRIRYAVEYKTFDKPLNGIIEVDETFVGGNVHAPMADPNTPSKAVVFGMLQRGGEIRAMHVPHARVEDIRPIIDKHISKESVIISDQSNVYSSLDKDFQAHEVVTHTVKEYVRGAIHTNSIEGFWSHMKRGINGIYHHVSKKHLHRYTDEFAYRYNSRKSTDPDRFEDYFDQVEGRLTWKKLIED